MSTYVAEACQPRQPYNIQRLEELRTDLIHAWGPATEELFDHLGDLSLNSASSSEDVLVGLRRSSKYSPYRLTTSLVEVSRAPSPPYTVLTVLRF